jgi:hypothetical protein
MGERDGPNKVTFLWNVARYEFLHGKYQEALRLMDMAANHIPSFFYGADAEHYIRLAAYRAHTRDFDGAEQAAGLASVCPESYKSLIGRSFFNHQA